MPTTINGPEQLKALAGKELGSSEWRVMDMARIRKFAEATGDHQWIHVDEERARRESPYGGPIAHGYLTLSSIAGQFSEVVKYSGFKLVVNYGTNKVRFPNPLKAGDRFRLTLKMGEVKPVNEWWEAVFNAAIEVEGQAKPSCAAECIYRFLPA
ncbi:MAG: MaoC family dehydratase [Deltaproteobacteria bacterium]|nr:MaoC family dehydratase [Deltaproteobacteria bacterium]